MILGKQKKMTSVSVSIEKIVGTPRDFRVKVSNGLSDFSFDIHGSFLKRFSMFLEQETCDCWIDEYQLLKKEDKLLIICRNTAREKEIPFEMFANALKGNEKFLKALTAARDELLEEREEYSAQFISRAFEKFDNIVWENESESIVANRFSLVFRGRKSKSKREMIEELKRWKTVCCENGFPLCCARIIMGYW